MRHRLRDISGSGQALAAVPLLAQAPALRRVEIEDRGSVQYQDGDGEAVRAMGGRVGTLKLQEAICAAAPRVAGRGRDVDMAAPPQLLQRVRSAALTATVGLPGPITQNAWIGFLDCLQVNSPQRDAMLLPAGHAVR